MKNKFIFILVCLWSFAAYAQFTTVTGTVTDSDNIVWKTAQVSVQFTPNPAYPNTNSYTLGGVSLTGATYNSYLQQNVTSSSSSGQFSVVLLDNRQILPAGSTWKFIIKPNASVQATVYYPLAITGSSEDISAFLSSNSSAPRFPAIGYGSYGYSDVEITPLPVSGGFYFNTTLALQRYWTGSAWVSSGGGGGSSGNAAFPQINITQSPYNAICDGAHTSADTAGFKSAVSAAEATGASVYVPAGHCTLDNSAGPILTGATNITIWGDGPTASFLTCETTGTYDCLQSTGATGFRLMNIAVGFGPTATTRSSGYPVDIETCSGCLLNNLNLNNGDLSALRMASSVNSGIFNIQASNFYANGLFLINNQNLTVNGVTCSANQDACFETSWFDSEYSAHNIPCEQITASNINSNNDLEAVLVNSCRNVSVTGIVSEGSAKEAIFVGQDPTTTTVQWPDRVSISNANIYGSGYGTNPLNSNTAQALYINVGTTPPAGTISHIEFSNINATHISGWGLQMAEYQNDDVSISNSIFKDVGQGASGGAGCLDTGGNNFSYSNIVCSTIGTYTLYVVNTVNLTGTNLVGIGSNSVGSGTNAIYLSTTATGLVNTNLTTLQDTNATTYSSSVYDGSSSGVHNLYDIHSSGILTPTGPTSSNTATGYSYSDSTHSLVIRNGGTILSFAPPNVYLIPTAGTTPTSQVNGATFYFQSKCRATPTGPEQTESTGWGLNYPTLTTESWYINHTGGCGFPFVLDLTTATTVSANALNLTSMNNIAFPTPSAQATLTLGSGINFNVLKSLGLTCSICTGTYNLDSFALPNAAGSSGQVQYNLSGNFAGSPNLTFDATGHILFIKGKVVAGVSYTDTYSGATFADRVNACYSDAVALANNNTSYVCSAINETGTQTTTTPIVWGSSSPTVTVGLELPCTANWGWTNTDGVTVGFTAYGGISVWSRCPAAGIANAMNMYAAQGSNLKYVFQTLTSTEPYMTLAGFTVKNTSTSPTASGILMNVTGPLNDGTDFIGVSTYDTIDTYNVKLYGVSSGFAWQNSAFNAGNVGTPLFMYTDNSGYDHGALFLSDSFTHPGPGNYAIYGLDTRTSSYGKISGVEFDNPYTETNPDGVTPSYAFSGWGEATFHHITAKCYATTGNCTAPIINVTNAYNTSLIVDGAWCGHGSNNYTQPCTVVNNAYDGSTGVSDSNGHFGIYTPNSIPTHLGQLTAAAVTSSGAMIAPAFWPQNTSAGPYATYFDDFFTLNNMTSQNIGTPTGASCGTSTTYLDNTSPGNLSAISGTGGTGTGIDCVGANGVYYLFNAATAPAWAWESRVLIPVLPGTTAGSYQAGLAHTWAASPWTTGIGFYLSSANGTANNWYCSYGSSPTLTNSTVAAVANTWTRLTISSDATNVHWYINGTQVCGTGTAVGSMPTAALAAAWTSVAGSTTSVTMAIDYLSLRMTPTR